MESSARQWCLGVSWDPNSGGGSVLEPGDGVSLAEFVEFFPGVTIEQAQDGLGHAARSTAMDQA